MNVCAICQADGILRINNEWFCVDHVDDGFRRVAEIVESVMGVNPLGGEEGGVA